MNMMTLAGRTVSKATRYSALANEAQLFAPTREVRNLDQARTMLDEAEQLIRTQEARIAQLENLALTDELTGLTNRRGLLLALKRELAVARRDKAASGMLVLIDLDGFKQVNDMWGHGVGDTYLQTVAGVLMKEVRSSDVVARIGGDEFAVLLTQIGSRAGLVRLERLEKAFNSKVMYGQERPIPLRASFGFSAYAAGDTTENILAAADLKLYAHKARHVKNVTVF